MCPVASSLLLLLLARIFDFTLLQLPEPKSPDLTGKMDREEAMRATLARWMDVSKSGKLCGWLHWTSFLRAREFVLG